ncbi:MAG: methyltransferase domain-containing protein, partial [Spirochaetes bacterium]|nr:methyltransferase domain-containing protein [Spirochaetota bacterium]
FNLNFGAGTPVSEWYNLDASPFFLIPKFVFFILKFLHIFSRASLFAKSKYKHYRYIKGKALPLKNNSCQNVYCSHVLEHLHEDEIFSLLNEFHRIIEKKGIVRIILPDMEKMMKKAFQESNAVVRIPETLQTLPYYGRSHKFRAVFEAFNGFHGCHKSIVKFAQLKKKLTKKWNMTLKKGYMDSSIPKKLLKGIENKERFKDAFVFEMSPMK